MIVWESVVTGHKHSLCRGVSLFYQIDFTNLCTPVHEPSGANVTSRMLIDGDSASQ
jgi:hypothetical protein